jgi:hypothetical protein
LLPARSVHPAAAPMQCYNAVGTLTAASAVGVALGDNAARIAARSRVGSMCQLCIQDEQPSHADHVGVLRQDCFLCADGDHQCVQVRATIDDDGPGGGEGMLSNRSAILDHLPIERRRVNVEIESDARGRGPRRGSGGCRRLLA